MNDATIFRSFDEADPLYDDRPLGKYVAQGSFGVPLDVRLAVDVACKVAADDLGIEPPRVLWFVPESSSVGGGGGPGVVSFSRSEASRGIAHRDAHAIAVNGELSPADALETAAHECCHLKQPGSRYAEDEELEALAYGEKVRGWLVNRSPADGHESTPKELHYFDGFPYNLKTLAGVAEHADVLFAEDSAGKRTLYTNRGSKAMPQWEKVEGRAA
ncbi:MAG: hypothetical protein ABSC51_10210 [Gaiellaceae bacterium]|jgi:hypothetical protein